MAYAAPALEPTLLRQALAAAPETTPQRLARPEEEYFLFRCGSLPLGVRSFQVRQVARVGVVTPLPHSPSFLLGVVGHRGVVVPVIDLLRFLGRGEMKIGARTRLMINEGKGQVVGFVADQLVGLRKILVADKMLPPAGADASVEFLEAIVHVRELGTLSLIDLSRVMQTARRKIFAT